MTLEQRFWSKVRKTDGCWLWVGSKNDDGYGRLQLNGGGGSSQPRRCGAAHRISWALANGEVPAGLSVLHRCDVPACCNPAHLFLGTQADNVRDMYAKGRNRNVGPLGEAAPAAKLTAAQVREILARPSSVALAREFGIGYGHMRQIKRGERWKHLVETP